MDTAYIPTSLGIATLIGDEEGISVLFISDNGMVSTTISAPLQEAVFQLQDYFEGKRTCFDLKLNPRGTDFQKEVWTALLEIPYGTTCSYLDLAKKLGRPKAVRAVASAIGKNPLWIMVPCHRVIGTDGSLTGYAGGLWRKKELLQLENPSQGSLF